MEQMMTEPELDDDGYPTEETLERIRTWPYTDCRGLLEFVQEAWTYSDSFRQEGNLYRISTVGWSGNEDLIGALEANTMFWLLCWVSSRRGGHYEFEVREFASDTSVPASAPDPAPPPGR